MNCRSCGAELPSVESVCMHCGAQNISPQHSRSFSELYTSFSGRIPRSTYWLKYGLPFTGIYIVAILIDIAIGAYSMEVGIGPISGLTTLILIYPSLAVFSKRLHDRNRSAWFFLLMFVPLVNIWIAIEVAFLRGTIGPNQYGPDPIE